jgi:hypothetical protein
LRHNTGIERYCVAPATSRNWRFPSGFSILTLPGFSTI